MDLQKHYKSRLLKLYNNDNSRSHMIKAAKKMLKGVEKKIDKVAYNQWHTKNAREFYFKFAK